MKFPLIFNTPLDIVPSMYYIIYTKNGGKFMGLLGDTYERMWDAILSIGGTKYDLRKKEDCLKYIKENPKSSKIDKIPKEFLDDADVAFVLIKEKGRACASAISKRLWGDKDFVLQTLKLTSRFLNLKLGSEDVAEYVSKELLEDRDFISKAVEINGGLLQYLQKKYQEDEEIVSQAVASLGYALKFAPKFQYNKKIVLTAVGNNSNSLKFASKEMKDDKEVVMCAVQKNPESFKYASERLQNDKDVVLTALKKTAKYEEEYKTEVINNIITNVKSIDLWKDTEVLAELKKCDNNFYAYAPIQMWDDETFVLMALAKRFKISKASERLQKDKKFLIKAVKQNGEVLADIPKEFKDDKDIVLAATEQYPLALQYASQKWRKDKNIITKLIRNNPCVIWAVPDECLEDTDFIIQLIQINQAVWHELPSTIQKQVLAKMSDFYVSNVDMAQGKKKKSKPVEEQNIEENTTKNP